MKTWSQIVSKVLSVTNREPSSPPEDDGERLEVHLRRLFELFDINCVIDVGANQGQYGDFLRQFGYRGNIISFEPSASDFELLQQRAGRDPLWHAYQHALGDEDTILSFNITSDSLFNSILRPNQFITDLGLRVVGVEKAEVKRLDDIYDALLHGISEPCVYLKMDTQGYDLNVLAGANGVLNRITALQSEVSVRPVYEDMPAYLDALARMSELGFEITGLFPIARDNALRVVEFDCVMVRASIAGKSTSMHPP
jgi:FkbM family methyltransferase